MKRWRWGQNGEMIVEEHPTPVIYTCGYCKQGVAQGALEDWKKHAHGICVGRILPTARVTERSVFGTITKAVARTPASGQGRTSIERSSQYPPRPFVMGAPSAPAGVERKFADEKEKA